MKEQPLYTILCLLTFASFAASFFYSILGNWLVASILLLLGVLFGIAFTVHAYYAEKDNATN